MRVLSGVFTSSASSRISEHVRHNCLSKVHFKATFQVLQIGVWLSTRRRAPGIAVDCRPAGRMMAARSKGADRRMVHQC